MLSYHSNRSIWVYRTTIMCVLDKEYSAYQGNYARWKHVDFIAVFGDYGHYQIFLPRRLDTIDVTLLH